MKGRLEIVNKEFGFIKEQDKKFFVSGKNMLDASNNDIVEFQIIKGDNVKVTKVLNRENKEFIGRVDKNKNFSFVICENINKDIYIPKKYEKNIKDSDIVKIRILKWATKDRKPEAEILKNYGNIKIAENIVSSKIDELKIPHVFTDEIKKEADNIKVSKIKREDLTQLLHVTIDGEDTKDMDDAVYIEKTDYGYFLVVSIADVSAYVKKDSKLDEEALNRSNSIYLYNRVIPMLPNKLTKDLCSLNPNEKKLALSVKMKLDENATILESEIVKSYINSKYKLSYTKVNEILNSNDKSFEYSEMLFVMQKLSEILSKKSKNRGIIDFDIPEIKLKLNEKNELVDIVLRKREKAEILIENFMILANEQVANYMYFNELPCIYRVHEEPDIESIEALSKELKDFDYSLKTQDKIAKKLQNIINLTKGTKLGFLIHKKILKSLKKAEYSSINKGHFGLALKNYLHFTSPIRRYSDLYVHRILSEALEKYIPIKRRKKLSKNLEEICKKISENERRAQKLEYLARDIKLAEYMKDMKGIQYKGIVSSEYNERYYILLENYIEVILSNSSRKLQLGSKIIVEISDVDVLKGKIYVKEVRKNGNSKK